MIPEGLLMKVTTPLIDSLVSNIIKPKLEKFAETCSLKYDELLIPRGEHFQEYLHRTYKKYSILNTLVFKNEQRLLNELYIPLTISKTDHSGAKETEIEIDKYPSDLVKTYNKILITDTAGMGKSTLTKRLFIDVIENGHGIPVFIEMRRLRKERPILHEIQEQINSLTKDFNPQLLLEFIKTGGFVFFLDGYDEISLDERSAVTANIQDFISKASNNIFFLTSRPEQALASFGDFQIFSINSLTKKEAYELLRRYDKQGSTSKQLIDELRTGQYDMINEFLKNPLLVSLLFAAFDYKHTIPLKKHIFYRQVYDAYFDSHDLSKGDSFIHEKHSHLDIDDFERILRFVGFRCLRYQQIEFEKDVLLDIINEAKNFCPDLEFNSSDFFEDILSTVPLFCRDGQYYKWVHKSLQEYFAAQFIYKDSKKDQDAILSAMYNSENLDRYINLLDLYYDIDNWGFQKNIILPLCKSYIEYFEENEFSSDILQKEDIENRIGFLFMHEVCIVNSLGVDDDSNIFEYAQKQFQKYFHNTINLISFHNNNNNFCAIHSEDPKRKLFPLLKKRIPHLFNTTSIPRLQNTKISIPDDSVLCINLHTGEHTKQMYIDINFYLTIRASGDICSLSYQMCKEKVDHISNILRSKEETSILVAGL